MANLTPEQEQKLAQQMAEICGYEFGQSYNLGWIAQYIIREERSPTWNQWRPWEEPEQAEMVVQAMMAQGYVLWQRWSSHDTWAGFTMGPPAVSGPMIKIDGYRPPLATCLAAREAVYGGG